MENKEVNEWGQNEMENIEIKQITKLDGNALNVVTEWMYNWWGKEDGYLQV